VARLDEIAEGLASVLGGTPEPEPLGVDLWNESPAATTVLVRAVIDSCARRAIPLSAVRVSSDLGKDLDRQLALKDGAYEGVPVIMAPQISSRVEFFRFPAPRTRTD
jgi:hypothetical protein